MKNLLLNASTQQLDAEHLAMLASLSEEDPKRFILDLLNSFKKSWAENFPQLKTACEKKDSASLIKIAHLMNGSAGNLGLSHLSLLFRNVEENLHNGTFNTYAECASAAEEAYRTSIEALDGYIKGL